MTDIIIYKNTDVDITITVSGLALNTMTNFTVTLSKIGLADIVFTEDAGDITIGVSSINLRIGDATMDETGVYAIRITALSSGDLRGLHPNPNFLTVL